MVMNFHIPFFSALSRTNGIANPNRFTSMTSSLRSLYSFTFMFLSLLLTFIILNGYINIIKNWIDQKIEPEWNDFFKWNFSFFGQYVALTFLLGLLFGVSFALLIFPGFILATKYLFAPYVMIDQNFGVSNSLDRSSKLVKGVRWQLFGLIFLYTVFILAPSFFLSYKYYFNHNASLLPYIYLMSLLSPMITNISQIVLSYLYFDLTAQQVELDKQPKKTEETVPPIPLEALMHPEVLDK
jgi:uncharacterized membrane protein